MAVTEHDKRYMAKLAEFLEDAESHTPASAEQRRARYAEANPSRIAQGLLPLEVDDDIPELEFFERARERGMLDRRSGSPRAPWRAVDPDRRGGGDAVPGDSTRHD